MAKVVCRCAVYWNVRVQLAFSTTCRWAGGRLPEVEALTTAECQALHPTVCDARQPFVRDARHYVGYWYDGIRLICGADCCSVHWSHWFVWQRLAVNQRRISYQYYRHRSDKSTTDHRDELRSKLVDGKFHDSVQYSSSRSNTTLNSLQRFSSCNSVYVINREQLSLLKKWNHCVNMLTGKFETYRRQKRGNAEDFFPNILGEGGNLPGAAIIRNFSRMSDSLHVA